MNTTNKQAESTSELKRQRTATRNAALAMGLLLVALLAGSSATAGADKTLSAGDWAWGGFAALAFASLLWALYVAYRQADERQKLVRLQATAVTFVGLIFSLVAVQVAYALDLVRLDIALQVVIAGAILAWVALQKVMERRTNP